MIMWEVVTHEIPVRGALRTIDVPKEAPEEVSAAIQTHIGCQTEVFSLVPCRAVVNTSRLPLTRPPCRWRA